MKKKTLIALNWKMNPSTLKEARALFNDTKKAAQKARGLETVICPPFPFLGALGEKFKPSKTLSFGAQDVFYEQKGTFTGEVSAVQLKSVNATYVIIGHSERRALGESDEVVNQKVVAALKAGLNVIFCIGESNRDDHGEYLEFLKNQIESGLTGVTRPQLKRLYITYEPIWAISSGKDDKDDDSINGHDLHQMVIFIEKILREMYSAKSSLNVPVLYGGSVSAENIRTVIDEGEVKGCLVGGKSLTAKTVTALLTSAYTR